MPLAEHPGLFLIGSSHHSAPLETREQFALPAESIAGLYARILKETELNECLILNTCNRVEIYGTPARPGVREQVKSIFCEQRHIQPEIFERFTFCKTDLAVIRHAFEVASGLDSQMVGETEILGQVKTAYADASRHAATGPLLNRVFQKSFQVAKWTRTHTAVGKGRISIGNIAAELATRVCGELAEISILVAGSGEVGEKTAQALLGRGARQFTVAGRNLVRARNLAGKLGGAVIGLDGVDAALPYFDILLFSTASPQPILCASRLRRVMRRRAARPLFIIDLAMPRDVEAEAAAIDNTYLYNLDDLAKLANENLRTRKREVERARESLSDRATHLWNHLARNDKCHPPKLLPVREET